MPSPYRILRKFLRLIGISLVCFYALACWFLYAFQAQLIFLPEKTVLMTPADYLLPFEEVWLPVEGKRMHGWWIPRADTSETVLYLHGNGPNIGPNIEQAGRFHRLGRSVLLFDYRGFGKSEGAFPSEQQVYTDAEAAWSYLTTTRRIRPEQIVLYGHSLGGAIGIELALGHSDAAGLIVESSFTSIADVARQDPMLSLFPIDWLVTQRFASLDKVPGLKMPLLFIHGTADDRIPFTMSQRLFAAAPQPKDILLVPGGGHSDTATIGGSAYLERVQRFLKSLHNRS